uniref:TLDc domain-containing protein n=1 Tax=Chromera velia CCMP2878 TaxID=1169474 RepID=A0A0G4I6Z3_9ALVE|eukprot:Cvel_11463.t1-p1 / transcript=Cvel_11463.t1 / gene=Cvel_11463 / organism=Chromera_velia_CCMP2878 / gene_product=hypothetical protein / transcript_product=hypothetical protein / location=Cvel_scaffold721:46854-48164(+) / protein_length=437 / sequence_SO=supercontig / SO=protein_coding / is_pseudo=false
MMESLKQIRELCKKNVQIISRIEQTKYITTFSYQFSWSPSTGPLPVLDPSVRDQPIKIPLQDFLNKWTLKPDFASALQSVPNDPTVVWEVGAWSDMRSLHQRVTQAVSFWEQMGATGDRAKQTLSVYRSNLSVLQKALYDTEEDTVSERSQLSAYKKKAQQLATQFNEVIVHARGPLSIPTSPDFHGSKTVGEAQAKQLVEWFGSGWQLLYRVSEDGEHPQIFHELCDGKGPTLTIGVWTKTFYAGTELVQRQRVLGGYTRISWRTQPRQEVVNDDESCLFAIDEDDTEGQLQSALFTAAESRRRCHTGPIMSTDGPGWGREYVDFSMESEQMPALFFLQEPKVDRRVDRRISSQRGRTSVGLFYQNNISSAYVKVTPENHPGIDGCLSRWPEWPIDVEVYGRVTTAPPVRTRERENEPASSASAASSSGRTRGKAA